MSNDGVGSDEKRRVEFHFQEGFTGQNFDLTVSGKTVATIFATTRFQTGLAHIEPLMLRDGEEVIIRSRETAQESAVKVHWTKPFVTVRHVNGVLEVGETTTTPGYL